MWFHNANLNNEMTVISNYTLEMSLKNDVVQNESTHDVRSDTGLR